MAVQYLGTSISGLSGDTKPTPSGNEKGLLFVETDTNTLYQWDTDSWNLLSNAASQITVTDNESTNEDNLISFVADAGTSTGLHGLEMDGNLTYNPSTGRLSAAQLVGTLQTAAQTNITSVGALDAGSITSNFGSINVGSSNITTAGTISAGNLTVTGTTTTVNSSTVTVVDPIMVLQTASGGGSLTSDTNKDVGLALQYYSGSAKTAFLGFDDSAVKLTFIPDATLTNEVASGTAGTIVANLEGDVTGAVTGNASSATLASTVTVVDSSDTSSFIAMFDSATGSLAAKTDTGLTYNAGTGILTATGFTGPLTGDVTGNVSGTSGSTTGNAATVTDGVYTTGNQTIGGVKTFSSAIAGDLTGDVTGDLTGNADTVTNGVYTTGTQTIGGAKTFSDNAVFGGNVSLGDSDVLNLGAGNDLQIYHDASNSYIAEAGTGILRLLSNQIHLRNGADNEVLLSASQNGSVDLYYDNSKKLETTAAGATITGSITSTAGSYIGNGGGSAAGNIGLLIDHDITSAYPRALVVGNNAATVTSNTGNTEWMQVFPGGTTVPSGQTVTHIASAAFYEPKITNNGTISGHASTVYIANAPTEGTTNYALFVDAGDSRFDGNISIADNKEIRLGDGDDLQIGHDASSSYIKDLGTGVLYIDSNGTGIHMRKSNGEAMATLLTDGAVTLYHDNAAKFATSAVGATITGALTTTDGIRWGDGGTYGAGGIYADSNWGSILTAFTASPAAADWLIEDAAGNDLVRIQRNSGAAIAMSVGGVPNTDWANSWSVLHLGDKTTLSSYPANGYFLTDNARYDGSNWTYIAADVATQFAVTNGRLQFRQGVSGSANANITWTSPLTIEAVTGDVGIGVADPDQKLEVAGAVHMSGEVTSPSAPSDGDGAILYVKSDGKLYFISNEESETEIGGGGGGGAGTALAMTLLRYSVYQHTH